MCIFHEWRTALSRILPEGENNFKRQHIYRKPKKKLHRIINKSIIHSMAWHKCASTFVYDLLPNEKGKHSYQQCCSNLSCISNISRYMSSTPVLLPVLHNNVHVAFFLPSMFAHFMKCLQYSWKKYYLHFDNNMHGERVNIIITSCNIAQTGIVCDENVFIP